MAGKWHGHNSLIERRHLAITVFSIALMVFSFATLLFR
jgi:hypothetical protein